jgi:hypothetical protein
MTCYIIRENRAKDGVVFLCLKGVAVFVVIENTMSDM